MDEALKGLEPELVWNYFDQIRKIPRCSKNEAQVVEYVMQTAKNLGLEAKKDGAGNVVILKSASPGYEDHPSVCLQGHLDMVCEKNADVSFDFAKDPILLRRKDNFIMAQGTTLGSDNGIGCAMMLAAAEAKDLKHPPLELLFTVDEETGLTGASKLTGEFLKSRKLINADSEDLDTITIGCAGGGDTTISLSMEDKSQVVGLSGTEIMVKGLKGGHSGVDIHLGRANAIKCLARALFGIANHQKVMLVEFSGGSKRNAIPREAAAKVLLENAEAAKEIIKKIEGELRDEYEGIEDKIEIAHSPFEGSEGYSQNDSSNLISLLLALPHGYLAFNPHIPDLVDTSTNLATVNMQNNDIIIGCNTRSSMNSAIEAVQSQIVATAQLAGAKATISDAYPSWKPNMDSELLALAKDTYKEKFGEEPKIKAIHAGLETGIIGEHFPGMDMISIGPDIEFPHSPDERLGISSVSNFWDYLLLVLEKL
ncbi:MAG: aminoacyl-histidine dipeptidase [Thermoplasmata archaeon]|nr:MAG: aminoacyl-histidine dipeptidase [Thermoplasmata archaeon]